MHGSLSLSRISSSTYICLLHSFFTANRTVNVSTEHLDLLNNEILVASESLRLMETIGKGAPA